MSDTAARFPQQALTLVPGEGLRTGAPAPLWPGEPPEWAIDSGLPEWVDRQLHIWWQDEHPRCRCSFEDTRLYGYIVSHPSRGCPLRTDCGGWTFEPPCGGCDRCLEDQAAYYLMKQREEEHNARTDTA